MFSTEIERVWDCLNLRVRDDSRSEEPLLVALRDNEVEIGTRWRETRESDITKLPACAFDRLDAAAFLACSHRAWHRLEGEPLDIVVNASMLGKTVRDVFAEADISLTGAKSQHVDTRPPLRRYQVGHSGAPKNGFERSKTENANASSKHLLHLHT